jgi:hypothetical protein
MQGITYRQENAERISSKEQPWVPAVVKKKRKIKKGGNPETTTASDCNTPEDAP